MTVEAPLTTTIKASGPNAPWVVIRSENTVQLSQQLAELQANTTFADLARANQAHFNVGSILGGRGIDAPQDTGAFATPAPAPAAPAAKTEQELFAEFMAAQQVPAAQQIQTYVPPAAPSGAPPGAPMVAGMPAKLVSGTSAKGAWSAWADPRPKDMTDHMTKTDDVNDPGLANGTKKLWKFIR
jgi:hypothetical protein